MTTTADSPPDLQPTLRGQRVWLRPLTAADFEGCYQAAADPATWAQHPDRLRYQEAIFRARLFDSAVTCGSALVVLNRSDDQIIGATRYYDWNPADREIAIGYSYLAHDHWGTGANTEVKRLMLNHVFQWADVVWFHVAEDNIRSRRAVEKLGAHPVRKLAQAVDGRPFVQCNYRLTRCGWTGRVNGQTH